MIKKIFIIILIVLALNGCERDNNMNEEIITAKENTQLSFYDIRIGISYIDKGEFISSDGEERNGLHAQLWPFIRNEEKGRNSIIVYEGQTIQINKYSIHIIQIQRSKIKIKIIEITD